ncbi:unnamed protein product [Staurois parvus]|uniref:Transposase Tc1-like domain-containing protein n=1 Tax=Staurois parvus TaxID=386267 RepID=A0ABN9BEH2_9NEOB|nr:unnamed protein product [Staurois parvus]
MTERGQRMLKCTMRRSRQLSAESIAKDLQTWCGLQISTTTVHIELHGMGFHGREQLYSSLTSSSAKCNVMDVSGFGSCQENSTCLTGLCQV